MEDQSKIYTFNTTFFKKRHSCKSVTLVQYQIGERENVIEFMEYFIKLFRFFKQESNKQALYSIQLEF